MGEEKTFVGNVQDLLVTDQEGAEVAREINIFCITGKNTGKKYRLRPGQVLFCGRSNSCEMFIDEILVSRRHAKFSYLGDEVRVTDLGSTNGTFVNGRKVASSTVNSGDRVQIGQTLMKVYFSDDPAADLTAMYALSDAFREQVDNKGQTRRQTFTGNLSLMPLPDLLQTMAANRSTGLLELTRDGQVGRVWCREGQVVYGSLGNVDGEKAVYRLLAWRDADFEFRPREPVQSDKPPIKLSLENLLMEGFRQIDEIERLGAELPPRRINLRVLVNDRDLLAKLPPPVRMVLSSIVRYKSVGEVLDRTPMSDLDIFRVLIALRKKRLIGVTT